LISGTSYFGEEEKRKNEKRRAFVAVFSKCPQGMPLFPKNTPSTLESKGVKSQKPHRRGEKSRTGVDWQGEGGVGSEKHFNSLVRKVPFKGGGSKPRRAAKE